MKYLSVSWAAITNYHRLGGLNNRHVFLTVPEVGESKIKGLDDLVPGKSPLPGFVFAWGVRESNPSRCPVL